MNELFTYLVQEVMWGMYSMCLSFVVVDNGGFSQSLYDRSRLVIHEFIALSRFCLKGGVGALDALVQNRLVGELHLKAY